MNYLLQHLYLLIIGSKRSGSYEISLTTSNDSPQARVKSVADQIMIMEIQANECLRSSKAIKTLADSLSGGKHFLGLVEPGMLF